jgi:hypothetical protein
MWKFLNLYVSNKNQNIYGWLESCGIELLGKGDLGDFMVSPHVDICLSSFPYQEKLKDDWDCEFGTKKRKQRSILLTPEPSAGTAQKRNRHGGEICSVKPFVEQHSKLQARIVSKLSKVAQYRIRAELGDKSTIMNVQAVTLAVSGYLRRELTKYCTDESVLEHASAMMTRLDGNRLTCEVSMYMKGTRRLGLTRSVVVLLLNCMGFV